MQPNDKDVQRLTEAIELSKLCAPSDKAFSVGAIVFNGNDKRIATGYSRETHERKHAEEIALDKAIEYGAILQGGTLYSSLEPCGERLSGSRCCADLIIEAGIKKVVFALREPPVFVKAVGLEKLRKNGIEVIIIPQLGHLVEMINKHLNI